MPPMSAEDLTDLDFTQMLRARPPAPAPVDVPDGRIGRIGPAHAGNFIFYARGGVTPPAATAEAPIVIVEDDEITLQLLSKALATHGYPVRGAADSRQLQELIRKPPLPRLILLDVELPQINGFKILSVLRQHPQTRAIPLVMLTARSENKDLLHALSLGADGYISKPVTVAALRAMVDRLLRKAA
jgi:CheY-like chemotaxis protein